MRNHLVIWNEGGVITRVVSDVPLNIECLVVTTDLSEVNRGRPWARAVSLPGSGESRDVLIGGLAVDVSPADVAAVVEANVRMRAQVMTLLQDTPESDEGRE